MNNRPTELKTSPFLFLDASAIVATRKHTYDLWHKNFSHMRTGRFMFPSSQLFGPGVSGRGAGRDPDNVVEAVRVPDTTAGRAPAHPTVRRFGFGAVRESSEGAALPRMMVGQRQGQGQGQGPPHIPSYP